MKMEEVRSIGLVLVTLLLAVAAGISAVAQEGTAEAIAWLASDGITVDGNLEEWIQTAPIELNDASQLIRGANFWDGPEGLSGTFYLMWDAGYLYVGAEILDDSPFMYREGFPPDQADSVAIFLSTDPHADPERTEYASSDFWILLIVDGYAHNTGINRDMVADPKGITTVGMYGYEQVLEGYEAMSVETEDGCIFEAKIPWAALASEEIPVLEPTTEMMLSFNASIVDIDMPCPGISSTMLAWTGSESVLTSPFEWGILRFEAEDED